MSETRTRVRIQIARQPGIHFNELVRTLDIAPGQVQHHIRRLVGDDIITEEAFYGKTHYYPPKFDAWERGTLALFRRETSRDVLGYLLESGPSRPQTVADAIGVARSTLEWHVNHLVEQDVVWKERDSRNRVTLIVSHPDRTRELLKAVSPSIPDRFVDRFTRLVDSLMNE